MLIPERVRFYCRESEGYVSDVFPTGSEGNHVVAREWSNNGKVREFPNGGFDDITIEGIERRGGGGRAYKVIIRGLFGKEGYRMDLREDTLMDVIKTTGISAGGKLNGTFCLANNGTNHVLILEGSKTHTEALQETEERKKYSRVLKKSELIPGRMYRTIKGKESVYMGDVYTYEIVDGLLSDKPQRKMLWVRSVYSGKNRENFLRALVSEELTSDDFNILAGSYIYETSHRMVKDMGEIVEPDKVGEVFEKLKGIARSQYDVVKYGGEIVNYMWAERKLVMSEMTQDRKSIKSVEEMQEELSGLRG